MQSNPEVASCGINIDIIHKRTHVRGFNFRKLTIRWYFERCYLSRARFPNIQEPMQVNNILRVTSSAAIHHTIASLMRAPQCSGFSCTVKLVFFHRHLRKLLHVDKIVSSTFHQAIGPISFHDGLYSNCFCWDNITQPYRNQRKFSCLGTVKQKLPGKSSWSSRTQKAEIAKSFSWGPQLNCWTSETKPKKLNAQERR